MNLTPEIIAAVEAHAAREYPNEACGVVTTRGVYVPLVNVAEDKANGFRLQADTFMLYDVAAVFHSHPDGRDAPTASDMQSQIATAVPWALCVSYKDGTTSKPFMWGGDYIPPLLGRQYRHGPSGTDDRGDCYAVIRDWYLTERGIKLPEFPRDDEWWKNGGDLYINGFAEAGFAEVSVEKEPQIGDCALMAINSKGVINHAAVYVGEGMILQQLCQRISRREPACRWMKKIERWVRYVA